MREVKIVVNQSEKNVIECIERTLENKDREGAYKILDRIESIFGVESYYFIICHDYINACYNEYGFGDTMYFDFTGRYKVTYVLKEEPVKEPVEEPVKEIERNLYNSVERVIANKELIKLNREVEKLIKVAEEIGLHGYIERNLNSLSRKIYKIERKLKELDKLKSLPAKNEPGSEEQRQEPGHELSNEEPGRKEPGNGEQRQEQRKARRLEAINGG